MLFFLSTSSTNLTYDRSGTNKTKQAATLPLLLTMILFLGPLVMLYYDNPWGSANGFTLWLSKNFTELSFWRNYIVGPFTEEWVFRSCMCPLLICGGFHWSTTIFLSPFFFGVAHLHHIIQHLHKTGEDLHNAWMEVLFQLFYTTVFGCYSAFLFLRTGHIIAPFLAHAFCNFMGFPQVDEIPDHPHKRTVVASFLVGLFLFCVLLFPITSPSLYASPFFALVHQS
ncbi:CAAX prenyl protease, variant 2 [Balamuthia mandrillaris]